MRSYVKRPAAAGMKLCYPADGSIVNHDRGAPAGMSKGMGQNFLFQLPLVVTFSLKRGYKTLYLPKRLLFSLLRNDRRKPYILTRQSLFMIGIRVGACMIIGKHAPYFKYLHHVSRMELLLKVRQKIRHQILTKQS